MVVIVVALTVAGGASTGGWLGFRWWQSAHTKHWMVQVTNRRGAELLVSGINGPMNEGTGYAILDPGESATVDVSHENEAPMSVVFDFASHSGPDGELIAVPVWQAYRRPIVCSWNEVQRLEPLIVTEEASSCADFADR